MKHLKRLRALIAGLFNRTFEATLPGGARVHVWPHYRLVLPVIEGADDGDGGEGDGEGAGDGDGEGEGAGGGEGEGAGEGDGEGDGEGAGDGDGEGDGEGSGEGEGEGQGVDWKKESRKHESRAKAAEKKFNREKKAREKLEKDAQKHADSEKSEHEKALEKAREEGKQAALTEAEKGRRKDRLEVAVTRLASKGVKVGDGDDAKTLRFADPEDAQVFIDRAIAQGDVDEEDIYSEDGKVNTEAVAEALAAILEDKPRLAAETKQRPSGSADGGKGKGSGKDLEDMSVEEHLKRIQKVRG